MSNISSVFSLSTSAEDLIFSGLSFVFSFEKNAANGFFFLSFARGVIDIRSKCSMLRLLRSNDLQGEDGASDAVSSCNSVSSA